MKFGDVIRKERTNQGLGEEETAERMGISPGDLQALEDGDSPAEEWAPRLAAFAIALETPTSRLIAESGRSEDAEAGQVGRLVRQHREAKGKSVQELAEAMEVDAGVVEEVESGESPLESLAPRLLAFAEAIDQPIFNLFYPCGLPFQELDDYP